VSSEPLPTFRVQTHVEPSHTVVTVSGEVDLATAPELRAAAMDAATGGARELIVDLRPVEFIDSSGLHVLVEIHREMVNRGGACTIVRGSSAIHRTFEIAGLDEVFTFIEGAEVEGQRG
jgi:anti-sigma B factor antagonist